MKTKKEYRYQFLKFDWIPSGKYRDTLVGVGLLGQGLLNKRRVEIDKEVAVIFDKQTGKIKYQDYDKK